MLQPPLTDVEVRVLGSLVEKEVTTPDNYPLSMNALVLACNQTSNRDPVMRLDEDAVMQAIVPLRRRSFLRAIQPAGSRVTKYQHLLADALDLEARELAVLGVLMLRGPQTLAELFSRTERLAEFAEPAEVEATLEALVAREPEPRVARLARRPGQKESRYAHLMSGEPTVSDAPDAAAAPYSGSGRSRGDDERVAALERTVEELRAEMQALRDELAEFRAQFQ